MHTLTFIEPLSRVTHFPILPQQTITILSPLYNEEVKKFVDGHTVNTIWHLNRSGIPNKTIIDKTVKLLQHGPVTPRVRIKIISNQFFLEFSKCLKATCTSPALQIPSPSFPCSAIFNFYHCSK